MGNNRDGLKCRVYRESIYVRLNKANEKPIAQKAKYR